MRRRQFLGALATLGALGPHLLRDRSPGRLDVSVWLTEKAATYVNLEDRVENYLRVALSDLYVRVTVRVNDPVGVSTERAHELMVSGEWPAVLATRSVTRGEFPRELNLLVTDGDINEAPTGFGAPYVAAVGGARQMAKMPPASTVGPTVPFTLPGLAIQLLLHEAGHALGLRHEQGSITIEEGHAVVSPMVSTYPWESEAVQAGQFDGGRDACGRRYPEGVRDMRPRLSLRYCDCARRISGGRLT